DDARISSSLLLMTDREMERETSLVNMTCGASGHRRGLMAAAKYSDFVLYRRVLGHVRPYWLHLSGILLLSLLSPPLALLNPLPLKIAVDSVIGSHPLPRFLLLLPASTTRTDAARLALTAGLVLVIADLRNQFAIVLQEPLLF